MTQGTPSQIAERDEDDLSDVEVSSALGPDEVLFTYLPPNGIKISVKDLLFSYTAASENVEQGFPVPQASCQTLSLSETCEQALLF